MLNELRMLNELSMRTDRSYYESIAKLQLYKGFQS